MNIDTDISMDIIVIDIDTDSDTDSDTGIGIMNETFIQTPSEMCCCVCFRDFDTEVNIHNLIDIQQEDITLDTIIKSPCNSHYICIRCLHTIVTDYTNHPINEHNSHVYCPYPFEDCLTVAGTKNTFDHQAILKILDSFEQQQYIEHSDRFSFPGYTIITCPCTYYTTTHSITCNYLILIENELVSSANIGELIVQCHQNERCCKTFCYHCRTEVSRYERECRICTLTSENANPNIFNRYIVKQTLFDNVVYNDEEYDLNKYFDENEYLYYNREITLEIALTYISQLIEHDIYCICPICKIHLYKTEKCNGLKHHNIELCYACGRVGTKTGGIHNSHWSINGINGCYRFDYDTFVQEYIPEYKCNDNCQSHENGDCQLQDHKIGIQKLNKVRKKSIIYHCIKSLLPNIRYNLVDIIHDKYLNIPTAYELLPYKQTFLFLEEYQEIMLDYSEETLYDHLNIHHPQTIHEYIDKSLIIDTQTYINNYTLPTSLYPPTPTPTPTFELDIHHFPPTPPRRLLPPLPQQEQEHRNIEIQRTITELQEIFNRMIQEEQQPLLYNIETDITDLLNSYLPLASDINSDTDTIYTPDEIPEEIQDEIQDEIPEEIQDEIPEEIQEEITIYYNTSDIYILGSESESESESEL